MTDRERELLDALREIVAVAVPQLTPWHAGEMANIARAAIAKAEGR